MRNAKLSQIAHGKTSHLAWVLLLALALAGGLAALTACSAQDAEQTTGNEAQTGSDAVESEGNPSEGDASAAGSDAVEGESDATGEGSDIEEQEELVPITIESLASPEQAEAETGIALSGADSSYAANEVMVSLPKKITAEEVSRNLAACEFIQESQLGPEMMVVGSIEDDGSVSQGSTKQSIVLLHTVEGVSVPQAVLALRGSKVLKDPQPNYILQAMAL